jgi:hypothetical protein
MVTITNDHGARLTVYRPVFEAEAPTALGQIENRFGPIGQGSYLKDNSDQTLALLRDAYLEAAEPTRPG